MEADIAHGATGTNAVETMVNQSISIDATLAPNITFASHQNDVAVLTDLVIRNGPEQDLEGAVLSVSADPPVIGTRSWTLDRVAGASELRPRDRNLPLAGGLLNTLTERLRADVRFELRQNGMLLAESTQPLTALARNEWGGSRFVPELLAAFVTPNDPAIAKLVKDASGVLASAGKTSSLEGYQSRSRSRVWEMMAAVWAAVIARNLTYAVPPASFELTGQKVRLPSEVESTGLATCLDTALLFCACFEQIGLHPVVVFTEGHAFAGAWLQPQHLPSMTSDDPMVMRKAVALDEIVLFETTMAAAGHALPFTKAIAEARRQMAEENDAKFVCAIDIHQARRRGIQPLSGTMQHRAAQGEGPATVHTAPALDAVPDLPPFDLGDVDAEAPQTPKERLDRWKRSLLDLSKRNRLLNLRTASAALPIFCPDPAKLEDRIAAGKKIRIIPAPLRRNPAGEVDAALHHMRTGDDYAESFALEALERDEVVASLDEKALEKGAIELYRKAKADLEEGGSNTLFLALGMLRWSPGGDGKTFYRAPMILLPVRMERASARSKPYLARHEDEPVFNLTLLQMLRQDFQIDMLELAGELPRDASGIDVAGVWLRVRARIKDVPGFEVLPEVALSTFSFAKYLMWKDLSERTDVLKQTPFVRHLIDHPHDPFPGGASFLPPRVLDASVEPANLLAPLNADSSQLVAIHASGGDGDFVLEGPPGTGKSETIGNIIAHNLGLGRRVLFVSEKMAALEVVQQRLAKAGLGDFCLELHSSKANKKGVLQQLSLAWDKRGAAAPGAWEKKAAELPRIRRQLNGLVAALHQPGPAGVSARDAMGRDLRFRDVHLLELDWTDGLERVPTPADLDALCETARLLGLQFSQLTPDDLAVFGSVENMDWSMAWQAALVRAARALVTAVDEALAAHKALLGLLQMEEVQATPGEIAALVELAKLLPSCARTDLTFALRPDAKEVFEALRLLSEQTVAFREGLRRLSASYPAERVANQPVDAWIAERDAARARNFLVRGGAVKAVRAKILATYGLSATQVPEPENDLEALRQLSVERAAMDAVEAALPHGTPWRGMNTDLSGLEAVIASAEALRGAVLRLTQSGRELGALRGQLARVLGDERDLLEAGSPADIGARRFLDAAGQLAEAWRIYRSALGSDHGHTKGATIADLGEEARGIAAREKRLNVWCAWVEKRREASASGLDPLVAALEAGRISPRQTADALRTAYCRWAAPLLIDGNETLKRFVSVRHESLIEAFRSLDAELAALTSGFIRAKLSSAVPGRNAPDASSGFGVLSRELQRQAKHMPVRRLVETMGSALTTLTPCLMMSPLSVAQFLPAGTDLFDLVVFDEASQITTYDAVGAIARGKRCIVVGDPKQMPPTRFFEKDAADGDDDDADLESILDEALAARVPLHRLTGHYRSRHESLIAFSNQAYYDGELVTYPAADTRDTAVSFRHVDGIYARGKARTNPIEAKALVAEAITRLKNPGRSHLSLGIVTLNSEQQRLIQDLLDDERRRDPSLERFFGDAAKNPVFVKNLETVQGDQRDVILLSVGFGPTEPGAATMSMSFGPLNRKGGERRLNVAITRATTEVMVFASFDPTMIDLTRTSSEAVRDLKHYLEFAQRGPVALNARGQNVGSSDTYDSDFEMWVAEGLRRRGWTVRTQIGVSKFRIDLGIVHPDQPGRFLAGVECDGAAYHSSPTARDRDRVRQIILEQLGWRLVRLWSTDWFLDPDTSLETLDRKLKALLEEDRARSADEAAHAAELGAAAEAETLDLSVRADAVEEPDEALDADPPVGEADREPQQGGDPAEARHQPLDRLEPLAAWGPALDARDPAQFYDSDYRATLRDLALAIIEAEGPVTFKRLSDLIAREHGFLRTGKQISSTVWSAVSTLPGQTRAADGHTLFWPDGVSPQEVMEFRGLSLAGRERKWSEVPLPERLGLMRKVQESRHPDPARAVAETIGYGRVTESFRDEMAKLQEANLASIVFQNARN